MEAVAYTDGDTVIEVPPSTTKSRIPRCPLPPGCHMFRGRPARREMAPVSVPVDSRLQCRKPMNAANHAIPAEQRRAAQRLACRRASIEARHRHLPWPQGLAPASNLHANDPLSTPSANTPALHRGRG